MKFEPSDTDNIGTFERSGYKFNVTGLGGQYAATAEPISYTGSSHDTGRRYFAIGNDGIVYADPNAMPTTEQGGRGMTGTPIARPTPHAKKSP
jgi:hypothetical protein